MQTSAPDTRAQITNTTGSRSGLWWILALVLGDFLSFLLFAGVGRESHNEASGLDALSQTVLTALPFLLAWFLVSPWLGAFRRERTRTPFAMLKRTELSWLGALPLALLLRWIFASHVPPLSFIIVLTIANALFLGVWRTVFAWIAGRIGLGA